MHGAAAGGFPARRARLANQAALGPDQCGPFDARVGNDGSPPAGVRVLFPRDERCLRFKSELWSVVDLLGCERTSSFHPSPSFFRSQRSARFSRSWCSGFVPKCAGNQYLPERPWNQTQVHLSTRLSQRATVAESVSHIHTNDVLAHVVVRQGCPCERGADGR
jgi:hypothetical protein